MKLKVGEKYELNNGEVHECTRRDGADGLFYIGDGWYTWGGCLSGYGPSDPFSVKRHIPNDNVDALVAQLTGQKTPNILDFFTTDAIRAAVMDALENQHYTAARELIDYLEAAK